MVSDHGQYWQGPSGQCTNSKGFWGLGFVGCSVKIVLQFVSALRSGMPVVFTSHAACATSMPKISKEEPSHVLLHSYCLAFVVSGRIPACFCLRRIAAEHC